MVAGSAGGSVVGDPNNGVFTTVSPAPCSGLTRQTGNAVTVSFVRTPDGQLIAATTGTSSTCFLTDNLGSAVGIVSSTGVKTTAYAYDPYGRTRTATRPNAAANAFRYAGGLFATPTGATKFGARYYDPNTGRFTQPDPSIIHQGENKPLRLRREQTPLPGRIQAGFAASGTASKTVIRSTIHPWVRSGAGP